MAETVAVGILWCVGIYAGIGVLFAVPFAWVGAGRIDPVARAGTWGFRLLILPGAAALWPYLLVRWVRGSTAPPVERNAHRAVAREGAQ